MGLCCLGGLRGLWGFCTRVELGGLEACGVFAFLFLSLPFFLSFSLLFIPLFAFLFLSLHCFLSFFALVVFACPLALSFLSCFGFVFSFSLTDYAQKERARRVGASSLRVSWVCYIFINSSK